MTLRDAAESIWDVLRGTVRDETATQDEIREETIAAVLEDGRYVVGGDALATKSHVVYEVGQRAHVLWRAGRRHLILGHHWKRAQPRGLARQAMLEELILAQGADGRWDVFYRNDGGTFKALDVSDAIHAEGATAVVSWGMAEDRFIVWTRVSATHPTLGGFTTWKVHIFAFANEAATWLGAVVVPNLTLPFTTQEFTNHTTHTIGSRSVSWPYDASSLLSTIALTPSGDLICSSVVTWISVQVITVASTTLEVGSSHQELVAVKVADPLNAPVASAFWTSTMPAERPLTGTGQTSFSAQSLSTGPASLVAWSDGSAAACLWASGWLDVSASEIEAVFTVQTPPNAPFTIPGILHSTDVTRASVVVEGPSGQQIVDDFTVVPAHASGTVNAPLVLISSVPPLVPLTESAPFDWRYGDLYRKGPLATIGTVRPESTIVRLTVARPTSTLAELMTVSVPSNWFTTWAHALQIIDRETWVVVAEDSPTATAAAAAAGAPALVYWPPTRGVLASRTGTLTSALVFPSSSLVTGPPLSATYPTTPPTPPDPIVPGLVSYRLRRDDGVAFVAQARRL